MVLRSSAPRTVIVALGAGLNRGKLGFSSRLRAIAAAALHRRHGGPVIMSGGQTGGHKGKSEADTMKDHVVRRARHRVPKKDVFTESTSLSTPENVMRVSAMLKKMGLRNSTGD